MSVRHIWYGKRVKSTVPDYSENVMPTSGV